MLAKAVSGLSALAVLLILVPPDGAPEDVSHADTDGAANAYTVPAAMLNTLFINNQPLRSLSHSSSAETSAVNAVRQNEAQPAVDVWSQNEPQGPSLSLALGFAILLSLGCCTLAWALSATQRSLLAALIGRQSFDVLLLLATWLRSPQGATAQLIAAALALLAGAAALLQRVPYSPRRWVESCWSCLLCVVALALGIHPLRPGLMTNMTYFSPTLVENIVMVAAVMAVHSIPLHALVVEWPTRSLGILLGFAERCAWKFTSVALRSSVLWLARFAGLLQHQTMAIERPLGMRPATRQIRAVRTNETLPPGISHPPGRRMLKPLLTRIASELCAVALTTLGNFAPLCCLAVVARRYSRLRIAMLSLMDRLKRWPATRASSGKPVARSGPPLSEVHSKASRHKTIEAPSSQELRQRPVSRQRPTSTSVKEAVAALNRQARPLNEPSESIPTHAYNSSPKRRLSLPPKTHAPGLGRRMEVGVAPSSVDAEAVAVTQPRMAVKRVPDATVSQQRRNSVGGREHLPLEGRKKQVPTELQKDCACLDGYNEKHKLAARAESRSLEACKENVPFEVLKEKQGIAAAIMTDRWPKRRARDVPQQGVVLQELRANDTACSTFIGNVHSPRHHSASSTLPVFVDAQFADKDSTGGASIAKVDPPQCLQHEGQDAAAAAAAAASADDDAAVAPRASLSRDSVAGHQAAVQIFGNRLEALRAFKCHLALGDLNAAVDVVSSSENCWSRQELDRFQSVLENAAHGTAKLRSGKLLEPCKVSPGLHERPMRGLRV